MLNDLSGRKILVTGGSGFLGRHLLPKLVAAGANSTVLVRTPKAAACLPAGVNIIRGDCGDANAVASAVKGHEIIIHLAGLLFARDWRDYLHANAAYARNIAAAVRNESRIKRVIFVSSLAAAGPSASAPGRKESDAPEPVSGYGWSKLLSEQILAASLNERLVTLRPPIIYGSGDRGLLPLFKSCSRGIGISPGLREFPVSVIHASDAANAIILAAGTKSAGIYHLSDGSIHTMDAICAAMGKALGRTRTTVLHPPLPLMAITAAIASSSYKIWRMGGKLTANTRPPAWNWDKFLESRQAGWLADGSKIVAELGFSPEYDLESGMKEAVRGYRAGGWL